jgi:hypothetical protein
MRFLFFSYFTTEKSLATVDVPGKMVARPPTNLSSNGYVFWRPIQASRYAALLPKLSMEPFTSGWRWYESYKALRWRAIVSISSLLKV